MDLTIICLKCGKETPEGTYCMHCGAELSEGMAIVGESFKYIPFFEKAQELEKQGNVDEAVKIYEDLIKANSGLYPHHRLAVIYRKQDDFENELRVILDAINSWAFREDRKHVSRDKRLFEWSERLYKLLSKRTKK